MSSDPIYVLPVPPRPSLPVDGAAPRLAIRRVVCVGRNYAAHARELGNDPRQPPFFFHKPPDAVVESGTSIPYPPLTSNFHHEIELVVVMGKRGADILAEQALDHVFGYAVGLDLTRRDRQFEARDAGRPWDWGKSFDRSAVCSAIVPAERIGHPRQARIWLAVNGVTRQEADIADMTWNVSEVIAAASAAFTLEPGDLIYTGTPAGVDALKPGDHITGGVDGIAQIEARITER